jgi:hypothetical protein
MAKKVVVELNKSELDDLESYIRDKVEKIVFSTRRSKAKKKGGHKIEDSSGDLRRSIKTARNFIKQTNKGLSIDFPVMEYYRFLDEDRRDELNWYLSEAIFEDNDFRDKIREIYKQTAQRAVIKVLSSIQP